MTTSLGLFAVGGKVSTDLKMDFDAIFSPSSRILRPEFVVFAYSG
jgi:hypothetical protein